MVKRAGMVVGLSKSEWEQAERLARLIFNLERQRGSDHGDNGSFDEETAMRLSTVGIAGEIAAANFLEVKWVPMFDNYSDLPDIPGWDVRTVTKPGRGLIIKGKDRLDRRFILMEYLGDRSFRVAGWIHGKEPTYVEYTNFGYSHRPKVKVIHQKYLHKEFPNE